MEVWYRPKGTPRTSGLGPTTIDIWYRASVHGTPETTVGGRNNWRETMISVEFLSMEALRASGQCIRVAGVGVREPFDPDLDVDEGL